MISEAFPYEKKRQEVLGLNMAYVDIGRGEPIVFLHGNPTSSYLWRNILPYTLKHGRCIVPDLIGMGDSDKLPNSGPDAYTFVEHRRYLDALLDQLNVRENVTFIVHDWGSALGFDWAYRHPDAIKGIAYMEAIIKTRVWSDMPENGRKIFEKLRSPEGEEMVLQNNSFIEGNLPMTIMRKLTEVEMTQYRRPFAEPGESRRPTLAWARQLPFDGEPVDVTQIVENYGLWLSQSTTSKLFIRSEPGLTPQTHIDFCRTWPEQTEVVARGLHYPQEDDPHGVGTAIDEWLDTLK